VASKVSALPKPSSVQESSSSSIRSEDPLTTQKTTSIQSSMSVTSTESDASKLTSYPIIPSATSTEPITVSSAIVPTSVFTGVPAAASTTKANDGVSRPTGSVLGVIGLVRTIFMVLL